MIFSLDFGGHSPQNACRLLGWASRSVAIPGALIGISAMLLLTEQDPYIGNRLFRTPVGDRTREAKKPRWNTTTLHNVATRSKHSMNARITPRIIVGLAEPRRGSLPEMAQRVRMHLQ